VSAPPADVAALAERCADALAAVPGVRAVVLGGSFATGAASLDSDVDLGLYYRAGDPLDVEAVRACAAALGDEDGGRSITPLGAWGPLIEGGGWLRLDGRSVDWLYRDLERMRRVVDRSLAGQADTRYQPGHPHGFRMDIHLAELATCLPLRDPYLDVHELRRAIDPYPEALRRELMRRNVWEASFTLPLAAKAAARGDVHHVVGCFYRCASCLSFALLAAGRTWCANEKGAVRQAAGVEGAPPGFAARVEAILGAAGVAPEALMRSAAALEELAGEVSAAVDAAA
jgi:hypothetical protein